MVYITQVRIWANGNFHRTARFATLGMSLSSLLDIQQPQDLLRGLINTLTEYDQSKEESDKPRMVPFTSLFCHSTILNVFGIASTKTSLPYQAREKRGGSCRTEQLRGYGWRSSATSSGALTFPTCWKHLIK
jgi:hypothetical protein